MPDGLIDLDTISAARREAENNRPVVKFGGQEFSLPQEMPFAVIESISRMQVADEDTRNAMMAESMGDISRSLFGVNYRTFLDLGPSIQDITALLEALPGVYGIGENKDEDKDEDKE